MPCNNNYHIFSKKPAESGNIVIYLLLALALFGALTLMMSRQNKQSDGQSTKDEQKLLSVNNIISYSAAVQGVIDQMIMSNSAYDDLNFVNPSSAGFDTGLPRHKVYHPSGGGLNYPSANSEIFTGTNTNPPAGWYLGRFNNVAWTPTSAHDVILTAHQISQPLCAALNKEITGSSTIPAIGGTGVLQTYLIPSGDYSGANADFTSSVCASCNEKPSLCVSNAGGTMWSFYTLIGVQ